VAILAALLAAVAALVGPEAAAAGSKSFRASELDRGALVFKLNRVDATRIRGARFRAGHTRRRLALRRVRAAARRGALRVRAPRAVRRRLERIRSGRARRVMARRTASRARLVVSTAVANVPGESKGPPPEPVWTQEGCAVPSGARYVAPSGVDSGPGTRDQPWRTLAHAESAARPGDTVVIRTGTYGARGTVTELNRNGTATAPISFVAQPGEPAPTILGQVRVEGNHRRLCGLLFEGPTGPVANGTASSKGGEDVQVWIMGDDVELSRSEVRGNRWHAGIYLYKALNARLVGNYVHDNGQFGKPSMANLDHGIYFESGSGLIADNLIEHNLAHGVQLYPEPSNVTVRNNTITGHGRAAIIFGEQASANEVVDNVITGNHEGIRTWELTGAGNAVRGNRIWANANGNFVDVGPLSLGGNSVR
jgi:Periplasmic copper-binding protein (NosD)